MKNLRSAVAAVAMVVAPACALAYDGTPEEQDACRPDVFSLCSAYIPNEDPIVACLKANRPQLSPACAHVLFPNARPARRARARRVAPQQ